jgi:hypothetical protein
VDASQIALLGFTLIKCADVVNLIVLHIILFAYRITIESIAMVLEFKVIQNIFRLNILNNYRQNNLSLNA